VGREARVSLEPDAQVRSVELLRVLALQQNQLAGGAGLCEDLGYRVREALGVGQRYVVLDDAEAAVRAGHHEHARMADRRRLPGAEEDDVHGALELHARRHDQHRAVVEECGVQRCEGMLLGLDDPRQEGLQALRAPPAQLGQALDPHVAGQRPRRRQLRGEAAVDEDEQAAGEDRHRQGLERLTRDPSRLAARQLEGQARDRPHVGVAPLLEPGGREAEVAEDADRVAAEPRDPRRLVAQGVGEPLVARQVVVPHAAGAFSSQP
jgi:hypothetical protein